MVAGAENPYDVNTVLLSAMVGEEGESLSHREEGSVETPKKPVLIVEDEEGVQYVLKRVADIELKGSPVVFATTLGQALDAIEKGDEFEFAIVDGQFPIGNRSKTFEHPGMDVVTALLKSGMRKENIIVSSSNPDMQNWATENGIKRVDKPARLAGFIEAIKSRVTAQISV